MTAGRQERPIHPLATGLPQNGKAIEQRSFEIIDRRLDELEIEVAARPIIRRVVHATADFSFAESLRIHPEAIERGVAAIRSGKPVIADARMLQVGITRVSSEILCAISDPAVIEQARTEGGTRATAAMRLLAPRMHGAVIAIGNAPTALWAVLELCREAGPEPALVIGLPVGFVGAAESKQALPESDLCYVTNIGPRGGTAATAAAANALALIAQEREAAERR